MCGSKVGAGANFCPKCGQAASAPDKDKRPLDLPKEMPMALMMPQEVIRHLWRCGCSRDLPSYGGAGPREDVSTRGLLVVTDQRLLYFEERGLWTAERVLVDNMELERIIGLESELDELIVKTNGPPERRTFFGPREVDPATLKNKDRVTAEPLRMAIAQAVEERSGKERWLDFAWLRSELERYGLGVSGIACSRCRATMSVPMTGGSLPCPQCGQVLFPKDVVERMRGLAGTGPRAEEVVVVPLPAD